MNTEPNIPAPQWAEHEAAELRAMRAKEPKCPKCGCAHIIEHCDGSMTCVMGHDYMPEPPAGAGTLTSRPCTHGTAPGEYCARCWEEANDQGERRVLRELLDADIQRAVDAGILRREGGKLIPVTMAEKDAEIARLRAALDALEVVLACGDPEKASLYDEEGVEGWRWTHPDGREWTAIGEWNEPHPIHPVASAALGEDAP